MDGQFYNVVGGKDEKVGQFKERKKHDRFNGMTEEEVQKRTLPDHLTPNLDIIIVSTQSNYFKKLSEVPVSSRDLFFGVPYWRFGPNLIPPVGS